MADFQQTIRQNSLLNAMDIALPHGLAPLQASKHAATSQQFGISKIGFQGRGDRKYLLKGGRGKRQTCRQMAISQASQQEVQRQKRKASTCWGGSGRCPSIQTGLQEVQRSRVTEDLLRAEVNVEHGGELREHDALALASYLACPISCTSASTFVLLTLTQQAPS
jgi:hypothetical protein